MNRYQMSKQERIEHLKLWIRDIDAYLQNPPLSLNCGEADRLGNLREGYQQELRELESSNSEEYIPW